MNPRDNDLPHSFPGMPFDAPSTSGEAAVEVVPEIPQACTGEELRNLLPTSDSRDDPFLPEPSHAFSSGARPSSPNSESSPRVSTVTTIFFFKKKNIQISYHIGTTICHSANS
jgi:hypothetical protein